MCVFEHSGSHQFLLNTHKFYCIYIKWSFWLKLFSFQTSMQEMKFLNRKIQYWKNKKSILNLSFKKKKSPAIPSLFLCYTFLRILYSAVK